MTQAELLELARQGNPKAIAALLNRSLKSKRVDAKVNIRENCLQVMLEGAEQVPDQAVLQSFVHKSILSLHISSVTAIKIYGRLAGEKNPAWSASYEVAPAAAPPSATPTPIPPEPEEPELEELPEDLASVPPILAYPPITPRVPISEAATVVLQYNHLSDEPLLSGGPGALSESSSPSLAPTGSSGVDPRKQAMSLKELAKEGDGDALTTFLNRAVAHKGIKIQVSLEDGRLSLIAEAPQAPEDSLVNTLVHRDISYLKSPAIQSILIQGRKAGTEEFVWTQEFVLERGASRDPYFQYVNPNLPRSKPEPDAPPDTPAPLGGVTVSSSRPGSPSPRPPHNPKTRLLLSILCHASFFVGMGWLFSVIVYMVSNDQVVRANAKEALNLVLALLVCGFLLRMVGFILVMLGGILGLLLILLFVLGCVLLPIFAIVQVVSNPDKPAFYPFIPHIWQ